MKNFKILCVKIFNDNYVWIIYNIKNKNCVIIDPGEYEKTFNFILNNGLIPSAIFITHHHKDHCGGAFELSNHFNIPIYGYINSKVIGISNYIDEGDEINIESSEMIFSVITLPGHTLDHVGYILMDSIFCGDTLFSGGCGKVFEGTYKQMLDSLNKLTKFNDSYKIYCSHEYTLTNLLFASEIDNENSFLIDYTKKIRGMINSGVRTIPTTLGLEKKINPFLRCNDMAFLKSLKKSKNVEFNNPLDAFIYIRELKNNFNSKII